MSELHIADAARPLVVHVLGLRMLTYTVGHEILLLAERNDLRCLADADFNQLTLDKQTYALQRAALICSTDYESYRKGSPRPLQKRVFGLFKRIFRLNIDHWTQLWCDENERKAAEYQTDFPSSEGGFNDHQPSTINPSTTFWALEIAEFKNYLSAGRKTLPALSSAVPEDAEAYELANEGEKLGTGRSLGAPMLASLILWLEKHQDLFRFPLSAFRFSPFDVPYAYAMMLFQADLESQGAIKLENHAEAQARWEMAEHRREIREEKLANAEVSGQKSEVSPDLRPPTSDLPS